MNQIFIDVREPDEYTGGHVPQAINAPLSQMHGDITELKDIPRDAEIVVYCQSGNRAGQAERILKNKGFTNVTNGINQAEIKSRYF